MRIKKYIMYTFELYRYQLLPISQLEQDLFRNTYSADEIRAHKNEFFDSVLSNFPQLRHRGLELKHKIEFHRDDLYIIKIGAHKSVDRDTEDFKKERIESWPNVTVLFHNRPDTQVIAISKNFKAFTTTASVVKIIERAIGHALKPYGLAIVIKEQFEKNNFWSIITEHRGRIARLRFEMVSPNMANISRALKIDFRQLNRESNCQKANLELEAVPGASLEIREDNELINGCLDYASQGGGDIAIKIKGIKKEIRTSTTVKSIEMDELSLRGPSSEIVNALKSVFK